MALSWITLYPNWYLQEVNDLQRHYPQLKIDESQLERGSLVLYGNLVVRPPGGAVKYPIQLSYLEGTPYEHPRVTPIESLPSWIDNGAIANNTPIAKMLDHRHQMPYGNLCLFQHESRSIPGGDILRGIDILKRAEQYFVNLHTNRWPPDTAESELESHFHYVNDILVEETFYESVPNGYGRFFFVPDIYRLRDAPNKNICPSIITSMTEESSIVQKYDARKELSRVYPWINESIWDSQNLIMKDNLSTEDERRMLNHGYWWSIPREPLPFHDGAGLLKTLALTTDSDIDQAWNIFNSTLGADLTTESSHFIGFRYPARNGGNEWLFLFVIQNVEKNSGVVLIQSNSYKRRTFEKSELGVIKVHRIAPSILKQRNRTVVIDDIGKKKVALIGLGALGSKVAELLAQAGVGKFCLCDNDRLKTGNVARHIGGIKDFGALKINVVMSRLLEINPYLKFDENNIVYEPAVKSLDVLSDLIMSADLVICTTADEGVESAINQLAVICKRPVLYGRAMRRGSMGRVFLVRNRKDACKTCLSNYLIEGREGKKTPEDWIDINEEEEEVVYHECGRPVIASSAIDLSFTASLIARVALNYLEGKDINHNHWIWSLYPSQEIDTRLSSEQTTFDGYIPPHEDCFSCKEPEVVELLMTEDVKQTIVSETISSTKSETGGILIGFIDSQNRAVAVRATGPGPKAIRTDREFHRDVEYIQSELDIAFSELGQKGVYIGEWHSHLNKIPAPSPKDIESLFGISAAPNYLTRCPVLVITGLNPEDKKVINMCSSVFPIGGRIYNIDYKIISREDLRKI